MMRDIRITASFLAGLIVVNLNVAALLMLFLALPIWGTRTATADVVGLSIKSERYYCRSNLFLDLSYCLSDRAYDQEQDDPEGFTAWQECDRTARDAYRDCLDAIERSDF